MIIYLSFFVFLFIVYVLAAQFVNMVPVGAAAENLSEGMTMLAQYDADRYILLMFHATLIQEFVQDSLPVRWGPEAHTQVSNTRLSWWRLRT